MAQAERARAASRVARAAPAWRARAAPVWRAPPLPSPPLLHSPPRGVAGSGGGAGFFGADGGVPVDAAVTCDDLHNQYAAHLLVARRCTVDASGQCPQLVASSFPQVICGPSGGQTYVNDASALALDWSEVFALHCAIAVKCGGGSSYSAIPDGGVCVATDGGSGLCAFLLPYATYP